MIGNYSAERYFNLYILQGEENVGDSISSDYVAHRTYIYNEGIENTVLCTVSRLVKYSIESLEAVCGESW